MTSIDNRMRVVIAGGGVVGLETVLALRKLAGDRIDITLLTPQADFVYAPMAPREPFGGRAVSRHSLARIADDNDVELLKGALSWVAPGQRAAFTDSRHELAYDALVVGLGARRIPVYEHVLTFRGEHDAAGMRRIVQDIEAGVTRRVAFVVPPGTTWPLPLYELALQTATSSGAAGAAVELTIVTPERTPLAVFGRAASEDVAGLLDHAGIRFEGGTLARVTAGAHIDLGARGTLDADRIVALPRLEGRAVRGLPSDAGGFIPVDRRGRVHGLQDVYAAGDGVRSDVKQGGVAAHQADLIAELIARRAGADVTLSEVPPTLRSVLITGGEEHYLVAAGAVSGASESPLWWPPAKIAARYLAPYLVGQ